MSLICTQCAIPVFNGLLPEPQNSNVVRLLFHLGTWHRLAKLHIHTDETLQVMDDVTAILRAELCAFQSNTCSIYSTRELKREAEECYRHQAQTRTLNSQSSRENVQPTGVHHKKTLNLQTYKLHALGNYTETIRQYGTTDSYSTQPVCCFLN